MCRAPYIIIVATCNLLIVHDVLGALVSGIRIIIDHAITCIVMCACATCVVVCVYMPMGRAVMSQPTYHELLHQSMINNHYRWTYKLS